MWKRLLLRLQRTARFMLSTTDILGKVSISGLDWSKILAVDVYRFNRNPEFERYSLRSANYQREAFGMIRYYLSRLLKTRHHITEGLKGDMQQSDTLFFKSLARKDYDEFFNMVADHCGSDAVLKYNGHEQSRGLNSTALGLFVQHLPKLFYLMRHFGSHKAVYFYTKIIYYLVFLKPFKRIKPRRAVVFADMHPHDNLIAQYFGTVGIQTATMQHGLYVDYGEEYTVNKLNYTNVVSNYFLAWGENTAQLIQQHHPDCETIICGKPTISETLKPSPSSDYFTVLFDQKMYAAQNQILLDIATTVAREKGLKVLLKLHPTTPRSEYQFDESLEKSIDQPWEESQFCIGHSTSMIYEILRRGMPVYKLQTEVPGHPLPDELTFESAPELLRKLNNQVDTISCGAHFVRYIGGESLEKYAEAIQSI